MDLRPSEIMSKLTKLLEFGSHVNTVADVIGAFSGISPSEKAPAVVKGIFGIFGQADERQTAVLLDDLEQRRPGSRAVLAGFFEYHAPKDTLIQASLSWLYGNRFRTFIAKMGASDGRVEGKKSSTVTYTDKDGKQHKEECTQELRRAGDDNALDFLEMMVKTIDPEGRVSPDPQNPPETPKRPTKAYLEKGYERLLKQFISFGYPYIPADVEKKVQNAFKTASTAAAIGYSTALAGVTRAADAVDAHATETRQKQGWFARLLQKI